MRTTPAGFRQRLIRVIFLTCTLVVGLTCVAFFTWEIVTFRRGMIRHHATLARAIAANATAALAFRSVPDGQEVLSAFKADPSVHAAALYEEEGTLFARYPVALGQRDLPAVAEADGVAFHGSDIVAFEPVTAAGGKRWGTLYFKADTTELYDRLRIYGAVIVLILAGALAMAYLIGRKLERRISAPLVELATVVTAIADRPDHGLRVATQGEGEIGQLIDAFNAMLARIEDKTRSLAALNRELEHRVQQRTAQLEQANRELESFSYSVSHDLRAPLRHVQGYVSMLQRSLEGQLAEKPSRYLRTINDASVEMGQLIDDLLDFSRMGRVEFKESAVALTELVDECRLRLEPPREPRRIEWKIAPLPVVRGDPAMLRQVWTNLLSNAVKYTRRRDPARISVGVAGQEAGRVVFYVRDNGAGFDMQYAHKLFGVFQRLHRADEFEGTGIGLATVRRIMARHGGRVWAEGAVNEGATFYFTLAPLEPMQTPANDSS